MTQPSTLKYGLRPTVTLADNATPFAAVVKLKSDDPDAHAHAIAKLTGSKEFAEAVSDMAVIHIVGFYRIDRDHLLFQTNFDGDVVSYFEGFKTLEKPLRAVLAHIEDAPYESSDFTSLLEWLAARQVDVVSYFNAYPELTVNQIRRDADWRLKLTELQKSLARPAGKVAWGQAAAGL